MIEAAAKTSQRIPELDGIRALAILAVLAVHCFGIPPMSLAAGELHGIGKAAFVVAAHGWLGVDLFFVLSGFLITGILLDSRNRPGYFHNFWVRRALRILPLVVSVIAILTIFYRPSFLYVLMALFFAVDFAPLVGLGNNGMGPLWSLAVEEQFYLVWPLLVASLRLRSLAFVALAVFLIEPIVRFFTIGGLLDVLWCRIDGLAIGAAIAIAVRSRHVTKARLLRAAALATGAAAVLAILTLRSADATYALRITEADLVFGAVVATAVAASGSRWLGILRSRTARFIADTSFCVYLIHTPLLDLAKFLGVGATISDPFAAAAMRALVALPLTFGIAALSRTYLEVPFLHLKDRFAPSTALLSGASPAASKA
jgi:peptidoglycan/LPS O-acetylase OafA/YrhL